MISIDRFCNFKNMEKRSSIKFEVQTLSPDEYKEIGSVGETVWSLCWSSVFTIYDFLEIKRSLDNDEVKIDVDVQIRACSLSLSKHDICLLKGQLSTRLNSGVKIRCIPFTIEGYVTVHYNSNCSLGSTIVQETTPSPQLVNDLLHLLDNPNYFPDATLLCSTAKFQVHRGILSVRSPVFAAMFKTQMQEGRDGVVNIVDVEPDVLQAMLRYVYSGKTDHLTHSLSSGLLFAADKYQLEELKLMCVHHLKVSMAANNVFSSLVLGDLHDKSLKAFAVEFICKYKTFSDLEKTEEWQSLLKDRPSLAIEVTTNVVKYLQDKYSCVKNIAFMNC